MKRQTGSLNNISHVYSIYLQPEATTILNTDFPVVTNNSWKKKYFQVLQSYHDGTIVTHGSLLKFKYNVN